MLGQHYYAKGLIENKEDSEIYIGRSVSHNVVILLEEFGQVEFWSSQLWISLTPAQAREIAAALLKAASDVEAE